MRTTNFGNLLFLAQYRMRYTIYIPLNKRDLAMNLTMWLPMETGKVQ